MDDSVNLAIAIDIINKKIAELNMKILNDDSEEIKTELDKYLKVKQEIYKGNRLLVKNIIDGKIEI